VLEGLTAGRWVDPAYLEAWDTETLYSLLQATIRDADLAVISGPEYPRLFGMRCRGNITAADVWKHLAEAVGPEARSRHTSLRAAVKTLLERGPLARQILTAVGREPSRERIAAVYRQLCECLAAGRIFSGVE
jgi:hypothetical protein